MLGKTIHRHIKMFGIGFKSKVNLVLQDNFNYPVAAFQMPVLNGICKEVKEGGMNEYDAAIKFMVIQMITLYGDPEDVNLFIETHSQNIKSILDLANSANSEIIKLLASIEAEHGLTKSEL